jgi:hypothetical protein
MKAFLKTSLGLAVGLLLVGSATAQDKKIDPNGKWTWTSEGRDGALRTNSVTLKLEGEKLSGAVTGMRGGRGGGGGGAAAGAPQETPIEEAKIKGDEVSFQVTRETPNGKFVTKYTAKITGDTMKGKSAADINGEVREREFEAKREAAKK